MLKRRECGSLLGVARVAPRLPRSSCSCSPSSAEGSAGRPSARFRLTTGEIPSRQKLFRERMGSRALSGTRGGRADVVEGGAHVLDGTRGAELVPADADGREVGPAHLVQAHRAVVVARRKLHRRPCVVWQRKESFVVRTASLKNGDRSLSLGFNQKKNAHLFLDTRSVRGPRETAPSRTGNCRRS